MNINNYNNCVTVFNCDKVVTMLTEYKKQLVVKYMKMAEGIAFKKKKGLPNRVDIEDLKSAAYFGLVDAAEKFNENKGNFQTYAYYRINGMIIDYLRELGWGKYKNRESAMSLDTNSDDEFSIKNTLKAKCSVLSDEFFTEISKGLSDKATYILKLHYLEGRSFKDIALIYKITESRVSQLMTSYKDHMRKRWTRNEFVEIAA